jgi:hypothetical protein
MFSPTDKFRMRRSTLTLLLAGICSFSVNAQDFNGEWAIDLRSAKEKEQNLECGSAYFKLIQTGEQITGSHQFYTVKCGRINEGGADSVVGVAVGKTAVLTVKSARTNTIVLGKAILEGDSLVWETLQEIYPGLQGDSPLILDRGRLQLLTPKLLQEPYQ